MPPTSMLPPQPNGKAPASLEPTAQAESQASFHKPGDGGHAKEHHAKDHQKVIQQRRLARRLALQALFEIDSVGHAPGVVVEERLAYGAPGEIGAQYLRWLVNGVMRNLAALNDLIAKYAPEWPVDQLAIIDRNVLRLALFEIGARDSDTPPKVVINEAVELAKIFGSDSSPRFVNGVLGSALDEVQEQNF